MKKELIAETLGFSVKSVYNYEKENRKIITLLKKYFNGKEIEEYLETGEIQKQELVKDLSYDKLLDLININDKTMAEYANVPVETIHDWKKNKPELITTIIQSLIKQSGAC